MYLEECWLIEADRPRVAAVGKRHNAFELIEHMASNIPPASDQFSAVIL